MKNKTKFQPRRLRFLAAHLMMTKFPPKKTIISDEIVTKDHGDYFETTTPYFHYVLMELPFVFPRDWCLDDDGNPIWREDRIGSSISSMLEYFGMDFEMFQHLLIPNQQNLKAYGGRVLTNVSTQHDIAYNILHLTNMLTES